MYHIYPCLPPVRRPSCLRETGWSVTCHQISPLRVTRCRWHGRIWQNVRAPYLISTSPLRLNKNIATRPENVPHPSLLSTAARSLLKFSNLISADHVSSTRWRACVRRSVLKTAGGTSQNGWHWHINTFISYGNDKGLMLLILASLSFNLWTISNPGVYCVLHY